MTCYLEDPTRFYYDGRFYHDDNNDGTISGVIEWIGEFAAWVVVIIGVVVLILGYVGRESDLPAGHRR
jgi:hypothetical protein